MITKATSFQTSDGAMHATVEDAQRRELKLLLNLAGQTLGADTPPAAASGKMGEIEDVVVEILLTQKDKVLCILGTKTRKPRTKATAPAKRTRRTNVPSPGVDNATQQQLA